MPPRRLKKKNRPSFDDVKRQLQDGHNAKDIKLNENDVICGRGNGIAQRQGNINFRRIIWEFRDVYDNAYRTAKKDVAVQVMEEIASLDPPGRFICLLPGNTYAEVPYSKALEKTCQALREKKLQPPPPQDEEQKPLRCRANNKKKTSKKAPSSSMVKSKTKPSKMPQHIPKTITSTIKKKSNKRFGADITAAAGPAKKRKTAPPPASKTKSAVVIKTTEKRRPKKSRGASGKKRAPSNSDNRVEEKVSEQKTRVKTSQGITPKLRYFNSKMAPLTEPEEDEEQESPTYTMGYVAPDALSTTFDENDFNDSGFKAQIDILRPQRIFALSPKITSTPATMTPNASCPPPPRQTIMEDICLPEATDTSDKPPLLPISGEIDNMISLLPPHLTAFVSGIFSDVNHASVHVEQLDTGTPRATEKRLDQMSSPTTVLPGSHAQAPRLEYKHSLFLEGDEFNEEIEDKNLAVAATLQEWGISALGTSYSNSEDDWWSLG